MRAGTLLLLALSACNTQNAPSAPGPESVRDRLDDGDTRLMFSTADSAGTITAQRRVAGDAWETGLVDLRLDQGEVIASADGDGTITIEKLSFNLAPISIPASVFNREASLSHVRIELMAPTVTTTTWTDDDEAHLRATFDLELSWALTIDNTTSHLGSPDLPPVTVEVDVVGDGAFVHADVRAIAAGELWSWANLIKLHDLNLVLAAETE